MCFEISFVRHLSSHSISQNFRYHENKALFEFYDFSQEDRNHASKTFSYKQDMDRSKMSYSYDIGNC